MNFVTGNHAYGGYSIASIEKDEDDSSYVILIKNKQNEVIEWKRFSASVPVTVEYSLNYDEDFDL